jgi:hypothetical protein
VLLELAAAHQGEEGEERRGRSLRTFFYLSTINSHSKVFPKQTLDPKLLILPLFLLKRRGFLEERP